MTALRLFLISLLRTKRVFWTLPVGGLLLFGLSGAGTPTTYGQGLSLVWSDEFNSVTSSNVDPTKWNFDTGNGGSNPGWGNNELEFYTGRTNNAYVAGGLLHIRAQIESTNGFSYTSARLKTQGFFWTTYGRIEWRAMLPAGVGLWPALWMLGTNIDSIGWPGCGEIDVVENNGATITFEQGSIHSGSDATQIYNFTGGNSVTNFNVYDLDWTSNSITWSVNGVAYETQTSWGSSTGNPYPFPFNQPFFLLMNVAVGGNYLSNPSTNSINPSLPNEMQVDYVRVYNFVTPPATPTGLTATGGDSFVTLNWNVSSNATSYYVKRALVSGGPYTTNANPIANSYTDTGVTNCMTYYYVVSGVNAGGESTNSDEAAASVGASIAVAPASRDFGVIVTGSTAQVSFVVTNPCGATLTGTAVVGGTPFTIASGSPFNIAGFGSTNVVVNFTPSSAGNFTNQVVFSSNGGGATNTVTGAGAIVPVPSFNGSPTAGLVPLAVTFTDTSTGTITNRSWTFGDGGTTNTLNTTVAYTYNATGVFPVSLTVIGPVGGAQTSTRVNYILVSNIPPRQVVSPGNRDFGLLPAGQSSTQTFSVANTGVQTLVGTATASGAPFALVSGSPFTVGGGQTGLVSVSFNPVAAGAFTGSVVFASNGGVSTNSVTGSGAVAPTAGFTGAPTNGAATLLVNFTDASSGTVTSRVWAFGDGGTSTLTSPDHSYTNAGIFSVSLTVLGPLGSNTLLRSNYITVTNVFTAPVAAFTSSPLNGAAPLLVNFTDASTGTITNHSWSFGDGNASTLTSPSHTYSNAGVYSVALMVSGPGGSSLTNRPSLITVTNALNTPPTVTIVRPANGMLYPPAFTNLTITVVASATSNDGAAISKIEFFEDSTKLGETTSNPGTNLLVHPTPGTHVISARASETFGTTNISAGSTVTVGAKNSPLGEWEVTISGFDKGAQFLTFEDDFSASGFGIRLKTFGLNEVSGHWGFNVKGQVTAPFVEETGNTTNWTGALLGTVKSLKSVNGTVPTAALGTFHWNGIPATTFPDLSGTWTGTVTVVKTAAAVSYVITANTNDSAVFDIATSADPGTVVGQFLVTSHNKVFGYVMFNSKQITFSGSFSPARLSLKLTGKDATAEKISVKIFKQ